MNLDSGAAVEPGSPIGSDHHGLRSRRHDAAESPFLTPAAASAVAGGLLSFIPKGRSHPTSIPCLMDTTGLSNRAVRAEIERLVVEEHIPIVTVNGVYIATTQEDIEEGIRNLHSRAMSMLSRGRALQICAERVAFCPEFFPEV